MEPNIMHQEVLLNTETQFAHRQWRSREDGGEAGLSAREQLEKACWDGLLKDVMPELDMTIDTGKKLWLWEIHETVSFLALDYCEAPGSKDKELSINPYLFLQGELDN